MATVQVFNANIEQAILSLRKLVQREGVLAKIRSELHFIPSSRKAALRRQENSKKHSRRRRFRSGSSNNS